MNRRTFLKSVVAAAAAGVVTGIGLRTCFDPGNPCHKCGVLDERDLNGGPWVSTEYRNGEWWCKSCAVRHHENLHYDWRKELRDACVRAKSKQACTRPTMAGGHTLTEPIANRFGGWGDSSGRFTKGEMALILHEARHLRNARELTWNPRS